MFIEFEETPNPNTLKFLPGQQVIEEGTRDYKSVEDAVHSPLAQSLFALEGVEGVFLAPAFVSVSKDDAADWEALKTRIMAVIMEHYTSGQAVLKEPQDNAATRPGHDLLDEISKQIVELIEQRVKPAVAQDGGNIEFVGFEEGVVYLSLEGACAGCPSATVTLKHGIENMLKHYVPEVVRVEQVQY